MHIQYHANINHTMLYTDAFLLYRMPIKLMKIFFYCFNHHYRGYRMVKWLRSMNCWSAWDSISLSCNWIVSSFHLFVVYLYESMSSSLLLSYWMLLMAIYRFFIVPVGTSLVRTCINRSSLLEIRTCLVAQLILKYPF